MIFYNYFENISDKFKLIIKNKTQSYTINFTNWSYYASDISKIIDDEIKIILIIYRKKKSTFNFFFFFFPFFLISNNK